MPGLTVSLLWVALVVQNQTATLMTSRRPDELSRNTSEHSGSGKKKQTDHPLDSQHREEMEVHNARTMPRVVGSAFFTLRESTLREAKVIQEAVVLALVSSWSSGCPSRKHRTPHALIRSANKPVPRSELASVEECLIRGRKNNLETDQSATIDAPLTMALVAQAVSATTPHARHVLDVGPGRELHPQVARTSPLSGGDALCLSRPMLDRVTERVGRATAVYLERVTNGTAWFSRRRLTC
jgi:hypothetical protein